jgi:hypothetical protein
MQDLLPRRRALKGASLRARAGEVVALLGSSIANAIGNAAVHQELPPLPNLTTIENMCLGHTAEGLFAIWRTGRSRQTYADLSQEIRDPPSPDVMVGTLSVAQRQKVALIRALPMRPRLLIVEGTSSLSAEERHEMQLLLMRLARTRAMARSPRTCATSAAAISSVARAVSLACRFCCSATTSHAGSTCWAGDASMGNRARLRRTAPPSPVLG